MASVRGIWISYDLGVNGDYESLYTWLDDHEAKECGSSVAYLKYRFEDELIESLKADLSTAVSLNQRSRIYVVFRRQGKYVGTFAVGRRKGAPWDGYGRAGHPTEDDGEQQ